MVNDLDNALAEELFVALSGIKRLSVRFPTGGELSPGEFFLLRSISTLSDTGDGCCEQADIHVSRLRDHMETSLPAVSQTLGSLEKKRLVIRTMDAGDRRRITVSLTGKGEAAVREYTRKLTSRLGELAAMLGEEDTRAFIRICARMTAVLEPRNQEKENDKT